jgi:hypothetical protein
VSRPIGPRFAGIGRRALDNGCAIAEIEGFKIIPKPYTHILCASQPLFTLRGAATLRALVYILELNVRRIHAA